ncbi:MAG TPA: hypothetical protein DCS93_00080 [Microscillaceae bacterium]|nr:hypothetical protein [Microscillaceae bacterium]
MQKSSQKLVLVCCLCLISSFSSLFGQNLPSLLTNKNINATFSIVAYDESRQEWGIAVATNNIYVGNSTIYIKPGLGAFSVIAETEPDYALNGFEQLQKGKTIKEAILFTKKADKAAHYRQVSGLDKQGNAFAFTGEALKYWNGKSSHLMGNKFVVMGNQLDEKVLETIATTYQNAKGTLAQRLLKSLVAGQTAGGQIHGKQSAALVVKGSKNRWFNQIDLRVDHSKAPFKELQRLLNYHYGRIMLNQATYALRAGNQKRATNKLHKAEKLLTGWNGMYSKIALVNSLFGNNDQAAQWVLKALKENEQWRVNLPAFYYLRKHPSLQHLIKPETFTTKNWEQAIAMFLRLGQAKNAQTLANKILSQGKSSSYLYYLLGKSEARLNQPLKAKAALQKAITLDSDNVEARKLLTDLTKK